MDFDGESIISISKWTILSSICMVIGLTASTQIIPADYDFQVSIDTNESEFSYFYSSDELDIISKINVTEVEDSIVFLNSKTNESIDIKECDKEVRRTKFLWGGEEFYCLGTIDIMENETYSIDNNHFETIHFIDSENTFLKITILTGGIFQNLLRIISVFIIGAIICIGPSLAALRFYGAFNEE